VTQVLARAQETIGRLEAEFEAIPNKLQAGKEVTAINTKLREDEPLQIIA